MMHLQVSKWGNSLALRIPADYVRQIGAKEGDQLVAHVGADGTLNLRPGQWSRTGFARELSHHTDSLPLGTSVMESLRTQARY